MALILQSQFMHSPIRLIDRCFEQLLGRPLIADAGLLTDLGLEQALYQAPFILLAHDNQADPVFNYANLAAQSLFELSWQEFTCLPSRLSAEQPNRDERAHLLRQVNEQGYIEHYSGIRISSSGQRFMIKQAVVWNLRDEANNLVGQAAMFEHWHHLSPNT